MFWITQWEDDVNFLILIHLSMGIAMVIHVLAADTLAESVTIVERPFVSLEHFCNKGLGISHYLGQLAFIVTPSNNNNNNFI